MPTHTPHTEVKGKWNVLSPDGIPIHPEGWDTKAEALNALDNYPKRFQQQGYYNSPQYGRLSLDILKACLELEFYPDDESSTEEKEEA
jgi:hypothetical protein